ncbi:MAG: hypothetical protein ABII79_09105 [bacterium]
MRWDKVAFALAGSLLVGLLVFFAGCGSDDNTTTGSSVDYNNPEFLLVQQKVNDFVDSTLNNLESGLENIYQLATDTTIDPVQYGSHPPDYDSTRDSASATYADGWHVVYFAIHRNEYDAHLRDSIRFVKAGVPQQVASGLDSLLYKRFWSYDETDTTVTCLSCLGNAGYYFGGLDTDQATISGSDSWQVHSKFVSPDSTVWRDISLNATAADIKVNKSMIGWDQGCPVRGSISASIQMIYQKDSAVPDTSNWTIDLGFVGGSMSAIVNDGSCVWTYNTQLCSPPTN